MGMIVFYSYAERKTVTAGSCDSDFDSWPCGSCKDLAFVGEHSRKVRSPRSPWNNFADGVVLMMATVFVFASKLFRSLTRKQFS